MSRKLILILALGVVVVIGVMMEFNKPLKLGYSEMRKVLLGSGIDETSQEIDPVWEGVKQTKSQGSATLIDGNFGWKVTKTGIDENLEIDYTVINSTRTCFNYSVIDKEKYEKDFKSKLEDGKDKDKEYSDYISNVPLTVNKGMIDLPDKIDFTQDGSFCVNYDNLFDGNKSFKLGKESVIIDNNVEVDALNGIGKNIYVDIYSCLNVAYEDGTGDDVGFARSCDYGANWITSRPYTGTISEVGILGNSTGGLFIYFTEFVGGDLSAVTSSDNGTTWGGMFDLFNSLTPTSGSCGITSTNIIYCCAYESGNNNIYCVNSTEWNTEFQIYNCGTSCAHSLAVGLDNCVYDVISDYQSGATADPILLSNSCTGWSTNTVNSNLFEGSSGEYVSISIANLSGIQQLFITARNNTANTQLACMNQSGNWQCSIIPGGYEYNVEGAMNNQGQIITLSASDSTINGYSNISNSTWGSSSWSTVSLNGGNLADYPTLADATYPINAKMDRIAHILFSNATGIWYINKTVYVQSGDTTPPSFSNTGVNDSNPSILDYVTFYSYWTDTGGLSRYIFSWNTSGILCDTWVNDSSVAFSNGWANISKQIPATCLGKINGISWTTYANDTSNNWNNTGVIRSFTVPSDTCTCTNGAEWNIDLSDNCVLTTACSTLPYGTRCYGSGSLGLYANLYTRNLTCDMKDIYLNNNGVIWISKDG